MLSDEPNYEKWRELLLKKHNARVSALEDTTLEFEKEEFPEVKTEDWKEDEAPQLQLVNLRLKRDLLIEHYNSRKILDRCKNPHKVWQGARVFSRFIVGEQGWLAAVDALTNIEAKDADND